MGEGAVETGGGTGIAAAGRARGGGVGRAGGLGDVEGRGGGRMRPEADMEAVGIEGADPAGGEQEEKVTGIGT